LAQAVGTFPTISELHTSSNSPDITTNPLTALIMNARVRFTTSINLLNRINS
jgi:hypothetical protein